jgi:hypothetical protein
MEFLSELIHVLQKTNPFSIEEIFPSDSKAGKLVGAITREEVTTDEQAALLVYEEPGNEKKYQSFKRNLINILSEVVFNTTSYDKDAMIHEKLRTIGRRKLVLIEKLLNQNVYHNAEKVALKVKACAERFQLLDLQIACITHLRTIYTLKGFPKEVEFFNIILKRLNKLYHYEQDAIGFMDIMESKTKFFIGKYREIAEEAKQYSLQLREWQQELNNPRLKLYQYKIDVIRCYHTNDMREWQYVLNRIVNLISKNPFLKTHALQLYLLQEWAKYFRSTANIQEATNYVQKALQQSDYITFSRFKFQEIHFDLMVKEEKYREAGQLLKEINETPQFHLLDPQDQAAWYIRKAYLFFIFLSLKEEASIEKYLDLKPEDFSITDLVNSCKAIRKDKKGYHFMLVVIKEALSRRSSQDEGDPESNNLLSYYHRYMKDSTEDRSKEFLKKFVKLSRQSSSEDAPKKETREKQIIHKNFDAAELIPFETFGELFLQKASHQKQV